MRRSIALALILAVVASVRIASALDTAPFCCACLNPDVNRTATTALFCVATGNEDVALAAARRCQELTGNKLECATDGQSSCHEDLAGIGVTCPAVPAPAAGDASLLALIVALGGFGALVLRRARPKGA